MGLRRDVLEKRRHSPFQVLDASAIEGIRGLAGESSSIYSCIQIYKALTPPAPPAYRGATEGPIRKEEGLGGGGGWNPTVCVPKKAQINICFCEFQLSPL